MKKKTSETVIVEGRFYTIASPNGRVLEVANYNPESGAARLEELGSAKTGFQGNTFNLTKEWLTFYALYPVSDNSKHTFTVIVNEVKDEGEKGDGGAEQSEAAETDYLQLELRHNPGGDTQGYTDGYYVSFNLTPLAERLEGKKGVVLHIETNKNGPQEIKLDLPQKK